VKTNPNLPYHTPSDEVRDPNPNQPSGKTMFDQGGNFPFLTTTLDKRATPLTQAAPSVRQHSPGSTHGERAPVADAPSGSIPRTTPAPKCRREPCDDLASAFAKPVHNMYRTFRAATIGGTDWRKPAASFGEDRVGVATGRRAGNPQAQCLAMKDLANSMGFKAGVVEIKPNADHPQHNYYVTVVGHPKTELTELPRPDSKEASNFLIIDPATKLTCPYAKYPQAVMELETGKEKSKAVSALWGFPKKAEVCAVDRLPENSLQEIADHTRFKQAPQQTHAYERDRQPMR
jgi:hypothetical protein